ncbi:Brix-domain-containing protein [Cantharellus anzutake]|uniref:Brix-domain-containing protein n=1 Tax=Cantharellus anzutake TaxID=1750568 RepID=UPI001903A587|nr:Brix-domain-containing protein [Cantharellus anzutake]KAF8328399.1 Brix-domain-containing protein [Cantharellus anzutake]
MRRGELYQKQKREKMQEKLKKRIARAKAERNDPEAKKRRLAINVPKTLDNMREHDPSMLQPISRPLPSTSASTSSATEETPNPPEDLPAVDEEYDLDISTDPFTSYFSGEVNSDTPPKVLITTSSKATKVTYEFCEELVSVVPGAEFIRRKQNQGFEIGRITGWAAGRGYSSLIVVNEDRKKSNALVMIHLPHGPTAQFRLTSVQLTQEISGRARPSPHYPELILNGFVTRLGHVVGRMFQTLFPPLPEFEGRQVVTLHNQRDFLFFRRHRYMFASADKAKLQEIGPRFTLKLRYIKKGTPAVKQLGAVPPPLQFDVDAEDEDDKEEVPASNEDTTPGRVDETTQMEEMVAPIAPAAPQAPSQLAKDEEYVWKWKPKLEVTRRTFFL